MEWPRDRRGRVFGPIAQGHSGQRDGFDHGPITKSAYRSLEVKTITEEDLRDQVVGGAGKTDTEAEIDFPLRSDIQIDCWEYLVLLLRNCLKPSHWTDRTVIFQTSGNFRREIATEFEVRREDYALVHAFAVKRSVERRIQRPVPAANFFIHNWADFPRPRGKGILPPLIAYFIREAQPHWPAPLLWRRNSRPDVISNPLPALSFIYGGEDVKATLEPVIEAMRDLQSFMLGVHEWDKAHR